MVDVRLRQEHPDLAAGRLLHDAREVLGHLLLEPSTDVLDRVALAAFGERLLRARERLFQHHDDEVLDDVRLRPRRALAVVLSLETHDLVGDRRSHLSQGTSIACTHRSAAFAPRRQKSPKRASLWISRAGQSRPSPPPATPVAGGSTAPEFTGRAPLSCQAARCSRAHGSAPEGW